MTGHRIPPWDQEKEPVINRDDEVTANAQELSDVNATCELAKRMGLINPKLSGGKPPKLDKNGGYLKDEDNHGDENT